MQVGRAADQYGHVAVRRRVKGGAAVDARLVRVAHGFAHVERRRHVLCHPFFRIGVGDLLLHRRRRNAT